MRGEITDKTGNGNDHNNNFEKNGKFKLKNHTEILFFNTAQNLITKGLIDECYCDELFDSYMIDFVLIKYVKLTKKTVRLVLHMQLKEGEGGAEKHKNKCPAIPVMIMHPNISTNRAEKKILRFFLRIFEESYYYKSLKREFESYI